MILEGEVDAAFDGDATACGPGDVAWAGVGCVHEFSQPTARIVRWLETQAPQPPAAHSYRFARDWDYLARQARAGRGGELMDVAVVGLGRMGAPIARRLEAPATSCSSGTARPGPPPSSPERGIPVLAAPAEALQRAEVCIAMLADPAALESIALGPDGVLANADGGTLVDMSTISTDVSAKVAAEAGRHGVAFLRAPVSGNPSVVRSREPRDHRLRPAGDLRRAHAPPPRHRPEALLRRPRTSRRGSSSSRST